MKVGLIDVDGHRFPNLALMKLSAFHKACGDKVVFRTRRQFEESPLEAFDRVYASKVFTFSPNLSYRPNAEDVRFGGTGYDLQNRLQDTVEHMMPDYGLYGIADTSYGFLSRGCPRGCPFCIVSGKEGRASRKVADLSEWWAGQKNIKLLDPNLTACPDCLDLLGQLKESRAWIDITQGIDIRLLTDEKVAALNALKVKMIHFAWDGTDDLEPLFRRFAPQLKQRSRDRRVYVLTNFNTTREWDLHRINILREIGYDPYMMIYDKQNADREYRRMQRWCNNKFVFYKTKWEDYTG